MARARTGALFPSFKSVRCWTCAPSLSSLSAESGIRTGAVRFRSLHGSIALVRPLFRPRDAAS